PVSGTMTNRVVVNRAMTIRSVNGPQQTIIRGYQVPGATNGDGAIRCAYLSGDVVLSGFTLTGGATRKTGDYYSQACGGGVYCVQNPIITNCVIAGNAAYYRGGGTYNGDIRNSII